MAPPTIDIIKMEEAFGVNAPRFRIASENRVGNIIDINNLQKEHQQRPNLNST